MDGQVVAIHSCGTKEKEFNIGTRVSKRLLKNIVRCIRTESPALEEEFINSLGPNAKKVFQSDTNVVGESKKYSKLNNSSAKTHQVDRKDKRRRPESALLKMKNT